jgi:RecA-family ATPase
MSAEHSTYWSENMPGEAAEIQLPEIVSAEQFMTETHEIPAELVKGLIHRGTLTMFAGGSKAAKTFTLMDLGLSVAHGWPFWGREVVEGRVLYTTSRLGGPSSRGGLRSMSEARGLPDPLQNFDIWNLRGYAADAQKIVPKITDRCREKDYSMIIIDPIYNLMEGRNENAAGKMAEFLNLFEKLSNETGAAVVYSHHFAKGLAAGKDQIDRASVAAFFRATPTGLSR